MNAIESLAEIDEVQERGNVPFKTLLYDVPQSEYFVYASATFPKSGLFIPLPSVDRSIKALQYDPAENLTRDRKKCDYTPVVTMTGCRLS